MPDRHGPWSGREPAVLFVLIAVTVAGLAVDAFVHLDLASTYDPVKTSTISEGDLFRIEGTLAVIAAVALALRPRRYTAGFAFLVAGGGLVAVLLYHFVDVGKFGPLPDMYDPVWTTKKALSAIGEGLGALTALAALLVLHTRARVTANRGSA